MRALLPSGVDVTGLELDTAVAAYLVDPAEGQASLGRAGRSATGSPRPRRRRPPVPSSVSTSEGPPSDRRRRGDRARRAELVAALGTRLVAELDEVGASRLWEEIERPARAGARQDGGGRASASTSTALRGIDAELTEEARDARGADPRARRRAVQRQLDDRSCAPCSTSKLGLKPQRRTKTGYSTDAATLEKLRDEHPIVEALLRYREVEKLRSTYGEGLLAEVAPDGRIHASFNQTVARTGRLSSDRPNLHNIPVRTDERPALPRGLRRLRPASSCSSPTTTRSSCG